MCSSDRYIEITGDCRSSEVAGRIAILQVQNVKQDYLEDSFGGSLNILKRPLCFQFHWNSGGMTENSAEKFPLRGFLSLSA